MAKAKNFLDKLQVDGRIAFSTAEYAQKHSVSSTAAIHAIGRLQQQKFIASPIRGFHIVLSPGDRLMGCRPPEEFVDYLMKHVGEQYYVALLSAAEIYGAAHQRPQVFQVMTTKNRRPVKCGRVQIQFIAKANIGRLPTRRHKVSTGYVNISTPESTAFDLIAYRKHAAGIDNAATVLLELAETIDSKKLRQVSSLFEVVHVQRLGYILEKLKLMNLAAVLTNEVSKRAFRNTPLLPGKSTARCAIDNKWKVVINERLEPDL